MVHSQNPFKLPWRKAEQHSTEEKRRGWFRFLKTVVT